MTTKINPVLYFAHNPKGEPDFSFNPDQDRSRVWAAIRLVLHKPLEELKNEGWTVRTMRLVPPEVLHWMREAKGYIQAMMAAQGTPWFIECQKNHLDLSVERELLRRFEQIWPEEEEPTP